VTNQKLAVKSPKLLRERKLLPDLVAMINKFQDLTFLGQVNRVNLTQVKTCLSYSRKVLEAPVEVVEEEGLEVA